MTTIRKASDRLYEASKMSLDAVSETAANLQERNLRFVESLLGDVERWQKDQQGWLTNGAELIARWQNYGVGLTRTALKDAEATQQDLRRLNEGLAANARTATEAGQELAVTWNKLVLSTLTAPLGQYASQFEDLRDRFVNFGQRTEANSRATA